MATGGADASKEVTLTLTADERVQLLAILEHLVKDKLVEVHRTEAPDYRQFVAHQEAVLESVINKLRRP
jgi:hypothetical protein